MKNKKVSIIIPVYNSEKYIKNCLASILSQTYRNIEIIIVDDESDDNSINIINSYIKNDKRIVLIKNKHNGAGVSRNIGLKNSNGEYIIFFDSDDFMKDNCIELLINNIEENNSDLAICKSYNYFDKDKTFEDNFSIKNNYINNSKYFNPLEYKDFIFQFSKGWAWDKLYKKEFIINNKLEFQNLKHSNDLYFVYLSLVLTSNISVLDDFLIYHRIHDNSLANNRENNYECFYEALIKIENKLDELNIYDTYQKSFVNFTIEFCYWQIFTIKSLIIKNKMFNLCNKLLFNELKINNYKYIYYYDIKKTIKLLLLTKINSLFRLNF